jgi:hypothetical protein
MPRWRLVGVNFDHTQALSRQISIGGFRRRIPPSALVIRERKQWNSRPPRCASRQYRIYSDNALKSCKRNLSDGLLNAD